MVENIFVYVCDSNLYTTVASYHSDAMHLFLFFKKISLHQKIILRSGHKILTALENEIFKNTTFWGDNETVWYLTEEMHIFSPN